VIRHQFITALLLFPAFFCNAEELVDGRRSLVFDTPSARLVVDLAGGAIGEFRSKNSEVNPLNWAHPKPGETSIRGFGHFLCLDRWGPASDAEAARGMPYHGEASNVEWTTVRDVQESDGTLQAEMRAKLPKAGFSVRRLIRMSRQNMVFKVREEITNDNPLGRVFNIVQHPTIGPAISGREHDRQLQWTKRVCARRHLAHARRTLGRLAECSPKERSGS
jgi:hypothetical protein